MRTKLIAFALLLATAAAVALSPSIRGGAATVGGGAGSVAERLPLDQTLGRPKVEAVFVLDTTGSMSSLIDAAKEKIWSIAASMSQASPAPEIRIGLVAYRDRGDAYVTQIVDLSADLDSMYSILMDFAADGGGDGPESVNRALHDAVHRISWSQDPASYKVVFLVGDAPPHMDYQDERTYPDVVAAARARGIVVNTIQCGGIAETTPHWQRIADLGAGGYFRVAQSGSAVAIATPFDARIAALSAQLDATRLYYGSAVERAAMDDKIAATEKLHARASTAAQARRGVFNATPSGTANLIGGQDLVADVESGRIELDAVPVSELPPSVAELPPAERRRAVEETAARRQALQREISELAGRRDAFIADELEARGGAKDSLDLQIYEAVRSQAADKGLRYESGPKF